MMASFPMFRAILLMIKYTAHNWRKRRIGFISIRIDDCTAHNWRKRRIGFISTRIDDCTAHNWRKRRIGFISIRIDCTAHTLTSSSAYSKNKYYDHSIV